MWTLQTVPQGLSPVYAHAHEHALEVRLPFLQSCFPHAKVVPLLAGLADVAEVGQLLESLWGGPGR